MRTTTIVLALTVTAQAFVPLQRIAIPAASTLSRFSTEGPEGSIVDAAPAPMGGVASEAPPAPAVKPVNGWAPNSDKFCYGLPGSLLPVREFDPFAFSKGPLNDVMLYREAELQHGRVAMMATVGYLVGEAVPWGPTGPANDQLAQLPAPLVALLGAAIGFTEWGRANTGWVEPWNGAWKIREGYYPGDTGFDPLGLKPKDAKEFETMATRELQNGRLAMLGAAGMCAQELVNHKTIGETLAFYSKVYAGGDPALNAEYVDMLGIASP